MLGDRKGVKAHLLGMNKMIELKGGLESLGLGGYTALQAKLYVLLFPPTWSLIFKNAN